MTKWIDSPIFLNTRKIVYRGISMLSNFYRKSVETIIQWLEMHQAINQPVPVKVLSRRAEAQRVLELQQYRKQSQRFNR